jgi:NifU-like protein involved in Fe-S cluster formation
MIDLSFEIGGQEVFLDQIENEDEKGALQQTADILRKSLNSVRCPQHRQLPEVTVKGETIGDLYFEVSGCCSSLIDEALIKISEVF